MLADMIRAAFAKKCLCWGNFDGRFDVRAVVLAIDMWSVTPETIAQALKECGNLPASNVDRAFILADYRPFVGYEVVELALIT